MDERPHIRDETGRREVFTIGHSNHSIEYFIELLKSAEITAVTDVRSVPYSRRMPHFSKPEMKQSLTNVGIAYVFLGDHLGARPKERSCYRDGTADYSLIAATQEFQRGLERVEVGARQFRVVLMCAERDPLDCHRTILVARRLQERGAAIRHILADGSIEPNEKTEMRLLKLTKLEIGNLFTTKQSQDEVVAEAYQKRGHQIAYTEEHESSGEATGGMTAA